MAVVRSWVLVVYLAAMSFAQLNAEGEALPQPPDEPRPPNVLIIVADDFGTDALAAYGEHPDPARTPVLDGIVEQGLLFRNAWATPGCSATRAMVLTGRLPRRTQIGSALAYNGDLDIELDPDGESLPKVLAPRYASAAIGKWHLADETLSGPLHPLLLGFDTHRGSLDNLPSDESYFAYTKAVDGQLVPSTTYATTDSVDDALAAMKSFGIKPWLVVLNFNAPHAPFHEPPADLHSYDDLPPAEPGNYWHYARAASEAMDTEIGRLLDRMDEESLAETVLFFVGDNGTDNPATVPPWNPNHAKGSPYEGGVNVPLVVAGKGVTPGECSHLVSLVDLFATICDLADADYELAEDSISFAPALVDPLGPPARSWVYSEAFRPNGPGPYAIRFRMLRDERYKLINRDLADELHRLFLFDLELDPFETDDLLSGDLNPEQAAAYDTLLGLMMPYIIEGEGGVEGEG